MEITGYVRRWLHLGPPRAELIAEARLWQGRCERHNEAERAAHVRAKSAEKLLRQERVSCQEEQARCRDLERVNSEILVAQLNEPDRIEGCTKIRFHRRTEAGDFAKHLADRYDEPIEALDTYPCKICPLSPVTMRRYWHVGHHGSAAAQAVKAASRDRRSAHRAKSGRDGKLIEQRVDPRVLAKLRKIGNETETHAPEPPVT